MKSKNHNDFDTKLTDSDQDKKHLAGFTPNEKYMIKLMAHIVVKYIINNRENLFEPGRYL